MWKARRQRKLEDRRREALSAIRGERSAFETMVRRAEITGEAPGAFVEEVRKSLEELEKAAPRVTTVQELDDLVDDAEWQGQLRAYACPLAEIEAEGTLALDVMEEWGVRSVTVGKLRDSLGRQLTNKDAVVARGALRALFEEHDSWWAYTDEYEKTMSRYTKILLWVVGGLSLLALSSRSISRSRCFSDCW